MWSEPQTAPKNTLVLFYANITMGVDGYKCESVTAGIGIYNGHKWTVNLGVGTPIQIEKVLGWMAMPEIPKIRLPLDK